MTSTPLPPNERQPSEMSLAEDSPWAATGPDRSDRDHTGRDHTGRDHTGRELPLLDPLVRQASIACDVPMALLALVEAGTHSIRARYGLPIEDCPHPVAFDASVILQDELFVVADARVDERFREDPLVRRGPRIRFYAGVPVLGVEGERIGVLSVMDRVPRTLAPASRLELLDLARHVTEALLRRGPAAPQAPLPRRAPAPPSGGAFRQVDLPQPAEADPRDAREMLSFALQAGEMGTWHRDLRTGELIWSAELARLFGLEPDEGRGRASSIMDRIHAEDLDRVLAVCAASRSTDVSFEVEFRVVVPGRGMRWVLARGRHLCEGQGGATRIAGVTIDITERRRQMDELCDRGLRLASSNALLEAIQRAHTLHLEDDPRRLFDALLADLLALTGSEFGLIGLVLFDASGKPYLRTSARTDIDWNDATGGPHEGMAPALEFGDMSTLLRHAIQMQVPLISNDPSADPRAGGLPSGRPPLKSFLGLPLVHAGQIIGLAAIANRPLGYSNEIVAWLEPFVSACAQIVERHKREEARHQADARLRRSEARARSLVAASSAIVMNADAEGAFVEPQTSFEEYTGYGWDRHQGFGWADALHPDDRERILQVWYAGNKAKRAVFAHGRILHGASGAYRWFEARALPVIGGGGEVEEWIATMDDVHERHEALELLRKSEERLRLVLQATNDLVWDWNVETGIVEQNENHCTRLGYARSDRAGPVDSWTDRIHPEDRGRVRALFDATCKGASSSWADEYRYRRADGSWAHVQDRALVQRDADGRLTRMIGAIQDITPRKEAEHALRATELIYRGLVQSVQGILWRADARTFRFTFVSDEAATLGYPIEQWFEAGFWAEHVHPDDREEVVRSCLTATRERRDHTFEYRFLAADGRSIWMRDLTRVLVREGMADELVGVVFDITELKQAQEALGESERRYRTVFEQAGVGIAQIGLDGRIEEVNERFATILGTTPLELTGRTAWEITHPEDIGKNQELLARTVRGELSSYTMEKRYLRADGSTVWANLTAVLMRDCEGRPMRMLGIIEDISERRAAQVEIQRLNRDLERRVTSRTRELEETLRELESFSYSVSHDLRAPLRGMSGFSRLLLDEYGAKIDATGRDWLERIHSNSVSMAHLIDGLLALARLSRDELHTEDVDLTAIARQITDAFDAAEPGRSIVFETLGDLRVCADPRLARILLENLLGNAWKFTARTADARVELGAQRSSEGGLVFHVRDNGAGFDMARAHKLFLPFERLHAQTEFPGSGIGLATVRRIVQRHGGWVVAEGAIGAGACIRFTLGPSGGTEPLWVPPEVRSSTSALTAGTLGSAPPESPAAEIG